MKTHNAYLVLAALLTVFVMTGCIFTRPVYTESRRPILPLPPFANLNTVPAELPEDRAAAVESYTAASVNTVRLIEYVEALEAVIDEYNRVSAEKNKANGYTVEPEPTK